MLPFRPRFMLLGLVLVLSLAACGSEGASTSNAFRVANSAMPAALSGESIQHQIPLAGGCGGPYIMQVIDGALPPGLSLDAETHSIVGTLLNDGEYAFTVQITDRGCDPFLTTTQSFTMSVGVGEIRVVAVKMAGQLEPFVGIGEGFNPAAPGSPTYNPDYIGLPQAIFGNFVVLDLVVAGGKGPYTMRNYDDPGVDDGALPFGTLVVEHSTSISGSPQEQAPNDGAFLMTFEITDAQGEKGHFTCRWLVYSPPIEMDQAAYLPDGRVGEMYGPTSIGFTGGVGPFVFEFVDGPMSDVRVGAADYPTPGSAIDEGPNYHQINPGVPPEGMYIEEGGVADAKGYITGIPRRRGTFKVYWHMYSQLLKDSALQNRWSEQTFYIAPAPSVVQDPAYLVDPAFTSTPPYARIPDAQQHVVYTLQLLAQGGCPDDGFTDAPHSGDRVQAPGENPGAGLGYTWTVDWDPDAENNQPVAHVELLPTGVFRSVPGEEDLLVPQLYQAMAFTATDQALPDTTKSSKAEKVRFSIGPDRVILTESSTSYTISSSYDNRAMNDTAMTLKVMIPSVQGNTMRPPDDADLVGEGADKILLPAEAHPTSGTTTVAALLSTMDLCRISVNPTGWWDDTNHLNPRAARPFQHSDSNGVYGYYRMLAYAGTTSYGGSSSYSYRYQVQPTATCVRLPKCTSSAVTKNKNKGVYTSGGKLYVFDSKTYFGVLVIREDGRLYVPAAFHKSATGWLNFGDNWTHGYTAPGSTNSINKLPQMTVSPDGRFAAFKLKASSTYSRTEPADDTAILLISLTGERIAAWDDEPYKIIATGSNGSTSQGLYHFAASSTLTNRYLYYVVGSGSTTYLYFEDHYIYRYDLFSGADAGALLHSNFNSEWTNASGAPMQSPNGSMDKDFDLYSGPDPQMLSSHGHNAYESSLAPHPFRVSADGNACAILAGKESTSSSSRAWDIRYYHVWVDYEGELFQLSKQRRHHAGGGRGIQLSRGITYGNNCYLWGCFDGPTSRFEISDDGLSVASVYTRYRDSSSYWPYRSVSYSTTNYRYRQDIVAYTTTPSDEWSSHTIHEITGDDSQNYECSGEVFQDSIRWRFGALTFTAENDGLVFWGGKSSYSPTAYSHSSYYKYDAAQAFAGSLYSYAFNNNSSGAVKNILSSTYGGANKTVGSNLTSISYSTSSWQTDGGVIKPNGGWVSPNRHFLYIITKGALSSSTTYRRDGSIIGVNIRSLDTSQSINGRTDGRAYHPSGLNAYDGFYPIQYYIPYGIGYYYYSSIYCQYYQMYGDLERAAATDNGWVFFCGVRSTGSYSSYTSSSYGGCINNTYYAYPYYDKSLYVFDQNVGGDVNMIIDAASWGDTGSYHTVGYIDVSDDGSTVAAVDSTDYYYDWNDQERLNVWSGIQLDASGDLVGTPTRDTFEAGLYVGSTLAFTPQKDKVIYAAGSGNENAKTIKRGLFGTAGQKVDYGFSNRNYNILHAGR